MNDPSAKEDSVSGRSLPQSEAVTAFRSSSYAVRPRTTWIGFLFGGRHSEYEFQSIPPMLGERYLFSWNTGILQRAPNGPALLAVMPPKRPGRFFSGEYVVCDAAAGTIIGRLVPTGSNWEVVGTAGRVDMTIFEEHAGFRRAKFIAKIDGQEVCVFSWAIAGITVHSAALDIEFLPGADGRFDRSLAIAIAPILEQKARLTSEWYTP